MLQISYYFVIDLSVAKFSLQIRIFLVVNCMICMNSHSEFSCMCVRYVGMNCMI